MFIESIFTFSEHPPAGMRSAAPTPLFDEIFDPFRDHPVNSGDTAGGGIPVLSDGARCPAADRKQQASCAVWALGSLIGTTTSHELGHSLGLADPWGSHFHNPGDAPNRLMDKGGARSFQERAELEGQGPSVFCADAYAYLRDILPSRSAASNDERPTCE